MTRSANAASGGLLFIVAAPSGAGKSSLVSAMLSGDRALELSISFTTRAPRPGERNGREYHFVDRADFLARRARGEFLESAEVHGNFYGTSRRWIVEQMEAGQDILLEIDWQGAQQVRGLFHGCTGVFVLPPSVDERPSASSSGVVRASARHSRNGGDGVVCRRITTIVSF